MARYIDTNIQKIDNITTSGLLGTDDSLAYRVAEVERHLHSVERWWGTNGAATETNAIQAGVNNPFVAISGNNDWGTAIPILGTADNPCNSGCVKYDAHRIIVVDTDHTTPYRIRIIWGSGTSAAAISAGQWSEVMFIALSGPLDTGIIDIGMRRQDVGTKLWVQVWNATNLSNVDFYWGCHGYEG